MNSANSIESIFHPRSIAVIGASEDEQKLSSSFLGSLLAAEFEGELYAVNAKGEKSFGIKIYPSLNDIPGPVDHVIISIPAEVIPSIIDDCVAKGVKTAHIFSSGFSESGTERGRQLEELIVRKAVEGGIRLIGPNCIGIYCPAARVPLCGMPSVGESGTVSFLSQSGGNAERLCDMARKRGVKFNKGISFGNAADVNALDILGYYAVDPETKTIGGYLEGVRDGEKLFQLLKDTSREKPVVIWKGGQSSVGVETAASHTGSLAGSSEVWTAALKQSGVVKVDSLEELADTLLAFQDMQPTAGKRAVVVAVTAGSGGISVAAADAFSDVGLEMLPIRGETKEKLDTFVPAAGAILRNPLDISVAGGNPDMLRKILEAIDSDPYTDFLAVYFNVDSALRYYWQARGLSPIEAVFAEFKKKATKPFVVILQPTGNEDDRAAMETNLARMGIPVYHTVERAGKAIANFTQYWEYRHGLSEA
ncbi:MAG: CoA-binding protein [Chloroflexota bacterium]|nr:CoA-binding protein [Chloroflexota bacterium]